MKHSKIRFTIQFVLCLVMLLAPTLSAAAQDAAVAPASPAATSLGQEPPGTPGSGGDANASAVQATRDDGGNWEVGIHGSAGNLTAATAAERAGMNYWLDPASNWVTKYSYGESTAWEEDFKRQALGGTEENYIDSVDLQFYVGHGSPNSFTFDNAAHDDAWLTSADCNRTWGNNDNEWLALTSCQVLADANLGGWAGCMNGQHLIMGFVTNAGANNSMSGTQAYHFGRYIMQNYTMPQAWYKACDVSQRGRTTRTIINELACLNDKPNLSSVCADSFDTDAWSQTHACGTASATYVPVETLEQMPVYRVTPYGLADATEDFTQLGGIFSIPVTPTVQVAALTEGNPFLVSEVQSRTLEMDKNSGLFNYTDLNQLWTTAQAEQAMAVSAASPNYINADDARTIADSFLRQNNLYGTGAVFYEVVSDTISSQVDSGGGSDARAAASFAEATETPVVWQVIYSRMLSGQAVTAAGVQAVAFSVVGPGAKQKVYVPVTAAVGAASVLDTAPSGVQGGWREVGAVVNAATGQQVMVDILTADQVKNLYLALPDDVPMNTIPMDIESREILSQTVAYWEEPTGVSQGELIPVYELKLRIKDRQNGAFVEDFAYVPASPLYMRPLARILDAPTTSQTGGTVITMNAADASKTLAQLGVADFPFALGSGNPDDYIYDWFLGSIDNANKIGAGKTLTYILPYDLGNRDGEIVIQLRVTDSSSPNDSFATANATITINPTMFLPLIRQ